MKNIDKITASVNDMINYRMQEDCEVCAYYKGLPCDKKKTSCFNGMAEWLQQENDPMPALKNSDIVETLHTVLVALDSIELVRPTTKERLFLCEIGKIKRIWRINNEGKYKQIWSDNNEEHR